MNWLIALITGSAELGSIAGDADKEVEKKQVIKPQQATTHESGAKSDVASSNHDDDYQEEDDDDNGYDDEDDDAPAYHFDESDGDPFQD